jgi:hypothetical protein
MVELVTAQEKGDLLTRRLRYGEREGAGLHRNSDAAAAKENHKEQHVDLAVLDTNKNS